MELQETLVVVSASPSCSPPSLGARSPAPTGAQVEPPGVASTSLCTGRGLRHRLYKLQSLIRNHPLHAKPGHKGGGTTWARHPSLCIQVVKFLKVLQASTDNCPEVVGEGEPKQ